MLQLLNWKTMKSDYLANTKELSLEALSELSKLRQQWVKTERQTKCIFAANYLEPLVSFLYRLSFLLPPIMSILAEVSYHLSIIKKKWTTCQLYRNQAKVQWSFNLKSKQKYNFNWGKNYCLKEHILSVCIIICPCKPI